MQLNSQNKYAVKEGDILKFARDRYLVRTVIEYRNGGRAFTLHDMDTKQTIYCYPSSKCYGAEIISK